MEDLENKISLKNELIRKTIHLSSAVIPLSYLFLEKEIEIIILSVLSLSMVLTDLTRTRISFVKNLYLKFLQPVLRRHETDDKKIHFTGGTYLVIAFLMCVLIFPKAIAITSMLIIIFSDSAAAVFGKVYGKHFIRNRTIEGSIAFFVTGLIIIFLTPKVTQNIIEYYIAVIALLLTTIFELVPNKIDDNISIPIFFGAVYLILFKIFCGV